MPGENRYVMSVCMSTSDRSAAPENPAISRVALAALGLAVLVSGCSNRRAEQIAVIADLPDPALVDQDGKSFGRQALEGRVWVTSFVFTHCRATCPRLIAQMKKLQARTSDTPCASFLSVSVDPRNDTPDVIKAYMKENELDERNWRFVTGSERAIEDFVVGGFKVGYGKTQWSTELTHSNSFALIDDRSRIRGYYGSDEEGVSELEKDLRALAADLPTGRCAAD